MGSSAKGLTLDRVRIIRDELDKKFSAATTEYDAIMSVLDPLIECWEHHEQGMTVESFDALNQALASPLEALAVMPVAQAGLACDQLKMAWGKLRGRLEWIE